MTREEAEKVARLIGYADHACATCVSDLIEIANQAFPEWQFEMGDDIDKIDEIEVADGCWPNQSRINVIVKMAGTT